jgi:hypothetical protein
MGKFSRNCVEMLLREDKPPRPGRAGTLIFGQEYEWQNYLEEAPNLVEILPITGNYMMMNGFPSGVEKKQYNMGDHKGGPYPKYHYGADKTMIFYGTVASNIKDLGAHVEFHMGEGEDAEVFDFDEPRAIFIPRGTRYGPIYITNFRHNLIIVNVLTVNSKNAAETKNDWNYIGDDKKIKEVIGDDMEMYKIFYGSDPEIKR